MIRDLKKDILHIGLPTILTDENSKLCKVTVPINFANVNQELWYSFPIEYRDYISIEVADAFVVGYLMFAMQHSLDIKSDLPISEKLLYSLKTELIPFFCTYFPNHSNINLYADSYDSNFQGTHVGTGLSCGIDSLSTIIRHGLKEADGKYKIDTLTLLNTGYYRGAQPESLNNAISRSRSFADEFGFNFIYIDTNIAELTDYNFNSAHTYLTNSTILLLQKYFSNYFYASGVPISEFNLGKGDSAYFDIVSLKDISTQSITFHSGCSIFTRVEKTKLIINSPQIFKHLYVCIGGGDGTENCSVCEKCIRTMLALESLGARDRIKERFNSDIYEKNRVRYISFALRHRKTNVFYKEICDSFKYNSIRIPLSARFCLIPTDLEINSFKSRIVSTKIGRFIYKRIKK